MDYFGRPPVERCPKRKKTTDTRASTMNPAAFSPCPSVEERSCINHQSLVLVLVQQKKQKRGSSNPTWSHVSFGQPRFVICDLDPADQRQQCCVACLLYPALRAAMAGKGARAAGGNDSHGAGAFRVQNQIRRNAQDMQEYLADLGSWEKSIKKKDK